MLKCPDMSQVLRAASTTAFLGILATSQVAFGQTVQPGEQPNLINRVQQADVVAARTPAEVREIRRRGMRVFTTPFNTLDGLGDGAYDPNQDTTVPGNRPRIQNLDTPFLRFNGLDAQTCLECHASVSTTEIPAVPGIGGTAGFSASPFPRLTSIDGADADGNGIADVNGRVINPPINFGGGGVALVGKEMTAELQSLRQLALSTPGSSVPLVTKGVDFGRITCFSDGSCNTDQVEGIGDDLVVRPFGRKGEFATTRTFDRGAMMFHHGMQPAEVVGEGVDADGDGVVNELTIGEMSALSIFLEGLEPPTQPNRLTRQQELGSFLFGDIGCADCHIPTLTTNTPIASFSLPQVDTDPFANVYQTLDLRHQGFPSDPNGPGVQVQLFADLKLHDMGDRLAESTGSDADRFFTTARLWGVADTAPYLHDGRATTISQAILFHDGEGLTARNAFAALDADDRVAILEFLRTLRNPRNASQDLLHP